jgi:two-component system chemotaxis response regulator CheB
VEVAAEAQPGAAPTIVVGVGASAGGVEALSRFVSLLPATFHGAVLVVLHIAPGVPSVLAQILSRRCRLRVLAAADDLPVRPGHVYIAPPDRHLLVADGRLQLGRGPQENGHRPAVDPLLRSIAAAYGTGAVGVILSGTRDDGTAGLARIKAAGGRALVQDPEEALYAGMPQSAVTHVDVDEVLGLEGLVRDIVDLASQKERASIAPTDPPTPDPDMVEATRFTCPECSGMLRRQVHGGIEQYVCAVGHVYSPESLEGAQQAMVEGALWAGARLLEDRATFLDEMAGRAERHGHRRSAEQFRARGREALSRSQALRELVEAPADDPARSGLDAV